MIEEIINFENDIEKESSLFPPTGLNILASFDENRHPQLQFGIFQNNKIIDADFLENDEVFFANSAERYKYSALNIQRNKRFDKPNCANASFSPFAIIYDKDYLLEIGKKLNSLSWENYIEGFFNKAKEYSKDYNSNEEIKLLTDLFEGFCKEDLIKTLTQFFDKLKDYNDVQVKSNKINLGKCKISLCIKNVAIEAYSNVKDKVLQKEGSSSNDAEAEFKSSDALHTYREIDKPFMYHYTASFKECFKINDNQIKATSDFLSKLKSNSYPKPLPLFIDRKELNNDIINLYNNSGKNITYSAIIEKLFKDDPDRKDIQNYYLIFTQWEGKMTKKFKIKDFDFVPFFRYDFPARIEDVFDNIPDEGISSIFDFEKKIVKELFDNCLVKEDDEKGKKRFSSYYFNEDPIAKTDNTYRLITKYRRAFFDFIYKSRTQAITGLMLKDIILSGVYDTLKDYENRAKNKQKEERIKRLLNIYFSINHLFDKQNINFNQKSNEFNMANRTKELIATVDKMVSNNEQHIESDEELAFDAGQLIYYLISQSEASNKSHSLLLTYLQKSDFTLLKEKIVDDVKRYGHAISFNNQKFNKLVSEVMGYELKDGVNKFTAFILAGYFSKNVLYSKS